MPLPAWKRLLYNGFNRSELWIFRTSLIPQYLFLQQVVRTEKRSGFGFPDTGRKKILTRRFRIGMKRGFLDLTIFRLMNIG